ncbi:MAG: preprotein translocase subunit SecA [Gammaproteobacteria bacterium]|nr:preprotein translocase subunit SecA [Gammaproteobacteria bacterium]
MPSQAQRPGATLGSYPEQPSEGPVGLDEMAHRTVVRATHRFKTSRIYRRRFLAQVNQSGEALAGASGHELKRRALELRQAFMRQGLVDELVVPAFALIREVSGRALKMRHYDSQVLGGWVMLNGMLAEMETGEGKTLTATLPACAAAMAGIPVHVITVNDYLAKRDAELMAPLYKLLGLTVGAVTEELTDEDARRAAYACDVTYCTNKQLAFDYLRDRVQIGHRQSGLSRKVDDLQSGPGKSLLLRGLCFAIVDEADSVLIDEARTPLILSRPVDSEFDADIYCEALDLADGLAVDAHFVVDEKAHQVAITDDGEARLEDMAAEMSEFWQRRRRRRLLIEQALSARHLYVRDRDYLVRDDKVQIIDSNTGRVMADRSWEMGLHQMVEAKEQCEVTPARESLAKITYQRFFRRYLRLGAMSGTATEVADELWSVYALRVVKVPSHKPMQRIAGPSRVYLSIDEKWSQVVARARELNAQQRPVLIGTRSVAASEHLSDLLTREDLAHDVLNARNDAEEANIVSRAGEAGRITVATNMAGRGTDISLGSGIKELGGLHVIATERNEARRIDRQLYGRCGRQGDPGSFECILSLEDELVALYAPGFVKSALRLLLRNGNPLAQRLGAATMRLAQLILERRHAQARRELIKLDQRLGDVLAFTGPME